MTIKAIIAFQNHIKKEEDFLEEKSFSKIIRQFKCFLLLNDNEYEKYKNEIYERKNDSNIIIIGKINKRDSYRL